MPARNHGEPPHDDPGCNLDTASRFPPVYVSDAKIGGANFLVDGELFAGAFQHHPAGFEHITAAGDRQRFHQVLLDQQNGDTLGRESP